MLSRQAEDVVDIRVTVDDALLDQRSDVFASHEGVLRGIGDALQRVSSKPNETLAKVFVSVYQSVVGLVDQGPVV